MDSSKPIIINPVETLNDIGDLSEHSLLRQIKVCFSKSKVHIMIMSGFWTYVLAWAFLFHFTEMRTQYNKRSALLRELLREHDALITALLAAKRNSMSLRQLFVDRSHELLSNYTLAVSRVYKQSLVRMEDLHHVSLQTEEDFINRTRPGSRWPDRFSDGLEISILFLFSASSTVGYGNVAPVTFHGRLLCFLFGLLGTPLAIITIGDVGKFLSEYTILLYENYKKLSAILYDKRIARFGPLPDFSVRLKRLKSRLYRPKPKTSAVTKISIECTTIENNNTLINEQQQQQQQHDGADSISESPRGSRCSKKRTGDLEPEVHAAQDEDEFGEDEDSEFAGLSSKQVPVIMVFGILIAYTALGAIMFSYLENWAYIEAFYFCFISLTTVGFGDLVPSQTQYLIIMLLYIGIGLAVTTMCIDLVGIQYIEKIHYFGRKFQGADLLTLLRRRRQMEQKLVLAAQAANTKHWISDLPSEVVVESPDVPPWPMVHEEDEFTQRVPTPSIISTSASVYERIMLQAMRVQSRNTSSPSGPDPSFHCSLGTDSSVYERIHLYDRLPSPQSWTESQDFMVEWVEPIDYAKIAADAKTAFKRDSCPGIIPIHSPPGPIGMGQMELWDSYAQMVEEERLKVWIQVPNIEIHEVKTPSPEPPDVECPPNLLSPIEADGSLSPSVISSPTESVLEFETLEFPPPSATDSGLCTETDNSLTDNAPSTSETDGEPKKFYRNMPVYTSTTEAVNSEDAILSAVNCPNTYITDEPPSLVTENFCFVVDGDKVKINEILSEAKDLWRPTGRPTKYYYSEDLKTFHKVQLVMVRGKPISARMQKDAKSEVTLVNVFKVSRYYSFWKSCPQFHRIVTVVAPVTESPRWNFKNRIFVQYLWREAKEEDKMRVALEWNPHASKLWKYAKVDTEQRKQVFNF